MTKKFVPSEISRYLAGLENTIIRLEEISAQMDDSELAESSIEGEWSILQILAHICACQDVWAYSIYAMLSVKDPELFPVHPRQMAAMMKYDELSFFLGFVFSLQKWEKAIASHLAQPDRTEVATKGTNKWQVS
jgi:hypothetical protein